MSTLLFRLSAPKRKFAPLLVPIARPVYQAGALFTTTTAALGLTDGFQPLIVPGSKLPKMNSAGPELLPWVITKSLVLLETCPVTVGGTLISPTLTPFPL